MKRQPGAERRQYPRIQKSVPVQIIANGYDFATNTQNLSCLGAYCHLDKYIPPFTKITVKLILPLANNTYQENCAVECKGVVVRTEDVQDGGFNIAVFFNQINDAQRKKISQYINQFLPKTPSRI